MQVTEALNGGLVQTRHPTLLKPSEVQRCDEMILKPGDPSPCRAPGRTAYGTVKTTSITCTPSGTSLSSAAAFGTDIASVVVTSGSSVINKTSAFGAVVAGQSVVGTGIPPRTYVKRVLDNDNVEMTELATASGTVTVTFSDLHPGTFISGTEIPANTYIDSITNASALTMSASASGTTATSRTFSEPVTGLVSLAFATSQDFLLLAKAADKLYTSSLSGLTGTFSALLSGLSQDPEATLQAVRHLNRHIVFTGFDRPKVMFYKNNAVTTRALGMAPVTGFVGPALTAGSWSALEIFQNGWYYFLITEVYNPGAADEVESTYSGDPIGIRLLDYQTQSIRITRNVLLANDGLYGRNAATHWRVYMSPKQSEEFPVPDLSVFRAIGNPIPVSLTETVLSDVNPFQTGYARTLAADGSNAPLFIWSGSPLSTVAAQDVASCTFTAASNILTTTGSFSTVAPGMFVTSPNDRVPYGTKVISKTNSTTLVLSSVATSSGTETVGFGNSSPWDTVYGICPTNPGGQTRGGIFSDFGIKNVGGFSTGVVTGVRVRISGRFEADSGDDRGFYISISKDGTNYGTEYWVTVQKRVSFAGMAFGFGAWEAGGQYNTWGLSWSPSDFAVSTFKVRLRKHGSAVDIVHYIDGIEVTIYEGGNKVNLDGDPFKTVVISDQIGNSFGVGAAGEPPICTTGDIIGGMFVSDDISSATSLVGSLPDDPDGVPDFYRVPLDDRIRVIRAYGHGGIIGCENTVKRLNYFPRETDADFSRGRAVDDIASDHGMAGPLSAAKVDLPGRGTVLAYLSTQKGMQWTDAVTSTPLNEDLDWSTLIEPTLIHRSILRVYPKYYLLALFYVPYGGTRRTKVMFFSYHPLHMKENFRLPAFGPVTCNAGSATSLLLSGASRLFTGHATDGKVYLEDSGTTDENSVVPAMTLRTRRFYASRIGHEGRIERVYLIADPAGNSTTGGFTATMYRQNQNENLTAIHSLTDSNTVYGGVIELWPNDMVETFEIEFSKSTAQTAAFRPHYIQFNDERDYGTAKLT